LDEKIKKDMDEYLESIGGLENGWFEDREPIKDSGFFAVNTGWFPLLKKLIQDLVELGWKKSILQVKEKFGGLRFYANGCTKEMNDLIRVAEEESYKICEDCGKPGELRDTGWYRTLCDTCHKHIVQKKMNK
jgi:hypothetical protein